MSAQPHTKWQRQMKALHREAAGCMEMWVVLFGDLPDLMAASRGGGRTAYLILCAISNAVQQIEAQPAAKPGLCGCCSRPLDLGSVAFVVTFPYGVDQPHQAMAMAICDHHGTDRESIRQAGIAALKDIWPDARPITIAAGGRA